MARAYIGIGSNINPEQNVRAALQSLAARSRVAGLSMVYLTPALGRPEQAPYFNCVAEIETTSPPIETKRGILLPIEHSLGRRRSADKYAARTIDLDLLMYGDLVVHQDGMTLPDPEIAVRPFLAIPLFELAPDIVLPGNRPIAEVAARLSRDGMMPLAAYARQLKQDLGISR